MTGLVPNLTTSQLLSSASSVRPISGMLDNTTLGSKYASNTGITFDGDGARKAPVFGRHDDYVEGGLDSWLVPAGEGLPGVCGLELRDGGPALLARHRVLGAVEAAHLIVEHARELQPQRGRAGRQGRGELHGEGLLLGIEADPRLLHGSFKQ